MSNNPSARKIQSRLGQIRQLEKECIYILIEHPTCLESKSETEEIIKLAVSHIDAKLKRTESQKTSWANAPAINLNMAIEEFDVASDKYSKKRAAKKVTLKLLEQTDAELMIIPSEIKNAAHTIASMYLTEL